MKFVMRGMPLAEQQARDQALYDMGRGPRSERDVSLAAALGLRAHFRFLAALIKTILAAIGAVFILGFALMLLKGLF